MNNDICFLITILYLDRLIDCALKVKRDNLDDDVILYPMEPENREKLLSLLPMHVKNCGPIVDVREIFDVHSA